MVGAFLTGIVGSIAAFAGTICLLLSLVGCALGGDGGPMWLIIGVALLIVGAYAKFSSGQSVRSVR